MQGVAWRTCLGHDPRIGAMAESVQKDRRLHPIEAVPNEGKSSVSEMNPDLMGSASFDLAPNLSELRLTVRGRPSEHLDMGASRLSFVSDAHLDSNLTACRTDSAVEKALVPGNVPFANGRVLLVYFTGFHRCLELMVGLFVFGDEERSGGVPIQAVDEVDLPVAPAHPRERNERPNECGAGWVSHHPGGFVHHQQALIFVQDFGKGRRGSARGNAWNVDVQLHSRPHGRRRSENSTGLVRDLSLADSPNEGSAGPIAKPGLEESIEAHSFAPNRND